MASTGTEARGSIGKRIKHALIGVPLLAIGLAVIWFGELSERDRTRALDAGAATAVTVDPYEVDRARDGKLVFLAGDVAAKEPLVDEKFGISATGLALVRYVDMYQWQEISETKHTKSFSGERRTKTVYRYQKTWSETPIDASSFKKSGYSNPTSWPVTAQTVYARDATIGTRSVDGSILGRLPAGRVALDADEGSGTPPEGFAQVAPGAFHMGDPAQPAIGDVRVYLYKVPNGPVSIVAGQQGNALIAHDSGMLLARHGISTADAFFAAEQSEGASHWSLLWGGLMLPLAIGLAIAPWLTRGGLIERSLAGGGALAAALVAIVWIADRPIIGGVAVVAALALVALLVKLVRPRAAVT